MVTPSDSERAAEVRQALRDKGLPEDSPLSVLIHQHRTDAALAATMQALAEFNRQERDR